MCGIAGVVAYRGERIDASRAKAMTDSIAHRGPDDAGYFFGGSGAGQGRPDSQAFSDSRFHSLSPSLPVIDSAEGERRLKESPWELFLGHRRLAILDVSSRGHQPMVDPSGQTWLAYNGEIYNFATLREELRALGHRFAGTSDTEVLLHGYCQWGLDVINRLNGMFAFAVWDGSQRKLHLARDRYGIKPLYYLEDGSRLLFGSEIKAILAYAKQRPSVDLLALNQYFSFQNVFDDRTLFQGIRILPPATVMSVDVDRGLIQRSRYWDFAFVDVEQDEREVAERLYGLIGDAIERQCVADVPIGSYLSGGMDSGTVTAIASRRLGRIATFTGGFDLSEAAKHELRFDERELAEMMASRFQTEHYECVLHAGDIEAVMPELVWHLEDLRVGQSYPNYYLARLASKFVKVALSGTGGDELFGGYPWRYATALGPDGNAYIQNYYTYWKRLVSNRDKPALFTADVTAALRKMNDDGAVPFHDHTLSVFRRVFGSGFHGSTKEDQIRGSLYFECKTFLHGLLVVEDKLSMAHSLETRVPFLDNDLVDYACSIPIGQKVTDIEHLLKLDENLQRKQDAYQDQQYFGKNILRAAMRRILSDDIVDARKQGFSAPDESWFRGSCQQYVFDRLLARDSRTAQYVRPEFTKRVLESHASGAENHRLLIWSLLCFDYWLESFDIV